jgi:hypothetical protein
MTWHCIQLIYELHSPLHIGWHRVGNLQRTRYYLPARNLWGSITERLTRGGFGEVIGVPQDDYSAVGRWVNQHFAFSYWFLLDGNTLLSPQYSERSTQFRFGELPMVEFERRYLTSHVTTSLDPATTSAANQSLHEVECIVPYSSESIHNKFCGWVFLDDTGYDVLGDEEKWRTWLEELTMGGERRYGFGKLRMSAENGWKLVNSLHDFPIYIQNQNRPRVEISAGKFIPAHALVQDIPARGAIEPLIGRETCNDSQQFGKTLTPGVLCWLPGSILLESRMFEITSSGWWKKV